MLSHFSRSLFAGHVYWCRPLTTLCQPFVCGELAIFTDQKGRKLLFKLHKEGRLELQEGIVCHRDIICGTPGQLFFTHLGTRVTIRRPSLEEYVLLMPRGPAPSYPKDVVALINMMDVGAGSRVLEAGSGSGGMTLYLSRAVGERGQVLSFEQREDHLKTARRNYQTWQLSSSLHHPHSPDNVLFFNCSITEAPQHTHSPVDAVALDIPQPWDVLHTILPLLRPCGVVAVYLPNVTQVVCLHAHMQMHHLGVQMENAVEVTHRQWTVKPARTKHHKRNAQPKNSITLSQNPESKHDVPPCGLADTLTVSGMMDLSSSYIARPSHRQDPHSGAVLALHFCSLPGEAETCGGGRLRDSRQLTTGSKASLVKSYI